MRDTVFDLWAFPPDDDEESPSEWRLVRTVENRRQAKQLAAEHGWQIVERPPTDLPWIAVQDHEFFRND